MDDRINSLIDRIENLGYSDRECDLLRFVDSENDDQLRGCVTLLTAHSAQEWSQIVEPESFVDSTLAMYAARRTLIALRTGSFGAALEAFEARLVLSKTQFESWRRGALYSAYVATSLGALPDSLVTVAAKLGDDRLTDVVVDIVDNVSRITSLRDVGRIDVVSHYGLGVLNVKSPKIDKEASSSFVYPAAPVLVRSADQRFDADSALALIAIGIADSIEQLPSTSVGLIQISEFPGEALIEMGLREHLPARACLSMSVHDDASEQETFQCAVADMESSKAVTTIIDLVASSDGLDSYICASGVGHYVVLLFELPDFGVVDDDGEFEEQLDETPVPQSTDVAATTTAVVARIESALSALSPETIADRPADTELI